MKQSDISKVERIVGNLRNLSKTISNGYATLFIESQIQELLITVEPYRNVLSDEEIEALRGNKYIEAIKLYRARTGSDLKTSKETVEKVRDQLGLTPAHTY